MAKKKVKFKLKPQVKKFLKIFLTVLIIILVAISFYNSKIKELTDIGYSKKASKEILITFKSDYALKNPDNKTLNAAFESDDFIEENLDKYKKIEYQNHKNLIKNINTLIKKKYNTEEISMILAHGSDSDVTKFAKIDKIDYLDEFYQYDYAKLAYYDRYVAYVDETGEGGQATVMYVNLNLDLIPYKNFTEVEEFSTDMLVNKYNKLAQDYIPRNLITIDEEYSVEPDQKGSKVAVEAFYKMREEAEKEGYEIVVNSGYRSYNNQKDVMDVYYNLYGQNYIDKYVTQPGFSEHQTGLAFDIASLNNKTFAESREYEWMVENAHKYGFILRYPESEEHITLISAEAWHYRYVGKEIATYIYENGITFEEYYVLFLEK